MVITIDDVPQRRRLTVHLKGEILFWKLTHSSTRR